jgi:PKHD-type hydroxylase
MQLQYKYWSFESALDDETCDRILELGKSRMEKLEADGVSTVAKTKGDTHREAMPNAEAMGEKSFYELGKTENDVYVRDSNIVWMTDQWLYDLIYPYIHEANRRAGWNWQFDHSESFQFTRYENDQFYGWHSDGQSDQPYKRYIYGVTDEPLKPDGTPPAGYTNYDIMVNKIRKISCTINISPPNTYEGGNLKFDFGAHAGADRFHECEEIRPRGSIIVFPSFLHHCVTPVTSGTRYSLVMWALGDQWK